MKSLFSPLARLPLARRAAPCTLLSALLALAATPTHAAEGGVQRYTPGIGGSDMTASLTPGWYGQVALLHYHATRLKDNEGKRVTVADGGQAASTATIAAGIAQANAGLAPFAAAGAAEAFPNGIHYQAPLNSFRADAYVILPRLTYLSTTQLFGANIGFTALLPLVKHQNSLSLGSSFSPTSPNAVVNAGAAAGPGAAAVNAGLNQAAAGVNSAVQSGVSAAVADEASNRSGSKNAISDLEVAPLFLWTFGDNQSLLIAPTLVLPTGQYDKKQPGLSAGFGNYYTFRPSVQYGYVGDGWDVGARAIFSFNTRNKDTDYKTGHLFNLDAQLMKFVTDDIRLGLQGYAVAQTTKDSSRDAATQANVIDANQGNKVRAFALGPAVAWVVHGGEALVEGKVMKEFGARNRTEGYSYWLTVSKPLGL